MAQLTNGVVPHRVFSATSKAILAGGYLVLDPAYNAFVIALSARMHAVTSVEEVTDTNVYTVTVSSPQFHNGSWSYKIDFGDICKSGITYKLCEVDGKRNPFVEATVLIVLAYAYGKNGIDSKHGKNITITMFSDPEYHSRSESVSKVSKADNPKTFLYHKKEIHKVSKTGLGSSAGLVTSLTAALLSCVFEDFKISETWKSVVHNLAQISHCKAQGKIGSGFDVASATFGSIIYQRFLPVLINELLESNTDTIKKLVYLVDEENWNMKHDNVTMPPGLRLLMGDVQGGSETPKLVTKVQKWWNEQPEYSHKIRTELNANNMKLVDSLKRLNAVHDTDKVKYAKIMQDAETKSGDEILSNSEFTELQNIATAIRNIRKYLKIMTVETGAEIEPDEQTRLLNSCTTVKGVLGGVVPGAGGHDAVCLLVSSAAVPAILAATAKDGRFSTVRWMQLHEQTNGLVEDSVEAFNGL